MEGHNTTAELLRRQITATEEELKRLKAQLAFLESEKAKSSRAGPEQDGPVTQRRWPLSEEEYKRYGRQMIVPNVGIQGQLRLKAASILIVGAGGLGCPASVYLAGAGVGIIGIVDGDVVETSNLHRQILHNTSKVGMKKVDSAISNLKALNPNIKYNAHTEHLTPQNVAEIVSQYDLVLDCTDHPTSRYLISDTCVLLQKPLVSASALRTDGQLIVLNTPPLPPGNENGGPCYRCVFPKPPPAESVVSCGDGGILGPVVGVMGVLQALEAVKLVVQGRLKGNVEKNVKVENSMLLFSANGKPQFRSLKMRARSSKCSACSATAELTLEKLAAMDYAFFCGVAAPVKVLASEERIEAREYEELRKQRGKEHLLLDVREKVQFDICSIEGSINVPFSTLQGNRGDVEIEHPSWLPETLPSEAPIYVVCRLGNDSQVITRKLKESGIDKKGTRYIGDIKGGFKAWKEQVDSSWPEY